jgi:hypothetical protein
LHGGVQSRPKPMSVRCLSASFTTNAYGEDQRGFTFYLGIESERLLEWSHPVWKNDAKARPLEAIEHEWRDRER